MQRISRKAVQTRLVHLWTTVHFRTVRASILRKFSLFSLGQAAGIHCASRSPAIRKRCEDLSSLSERAGRGVRAETAGDVVFVGQVEHVDAEAGAPESGTQRAEVISDARIEQG